MKILVTGSSSGIGQTLVRELAGAGHELWGWARRPQTALATECSERGQSFRWSQCDVSQPGQVKACSEEIARQWQFLDGLVCCAAVQGPIGRTVDVDPAAWMQTIAINLHGTFLCLRACQPLLARADRRAKVVCFSGGGATAPRPNFSAYAVSKTGVVRLVENLAHEWVNDPIDINAIAPGAVDTQMTDQIIALGPEVAGEKEYRTALEQKTQRGTAPAKYVGLTTFLLSPQSDGISGRLISAVWDPWPDLPRHRPDLSASDIYTLRRIRPEDREKRWT